MTLKANSFFFKILTRFLCVLLIISVAFGIARIADSNRAEENALKNLNIEFLNNSDNVQRMVSQSKFAMSELSLKFTTDDQFSGGTNVNADKLLSDMRAILVDRRQNEFSKYLSTAFVLDSQNSGVVYELTGAVTSDVFFNQHYSSETYTSAFWASMFESSETFSILPASVFSTAREAKRIDVELLPIAYKPQVMSRYIIVMLIDVSSAVNELGVSGIATTDGKILYSSAEVNGISEKDILSAESETKTAKGYVFRSFGGQNENLEVFSVVSPADVKEEKGRGGTLSLFVVVFSMLIAFALAVMFSIDWSKKISAVAEEVSKSSNVHPQMNKEIETYSELVDGVKLLALRDSRTSPEIAHRDSVLDSMFLQSRMRDVYVGINDIEENIDIARSFFMVYIRVNYKTEFENHVGKDAGKATFFLKQLIEMYLETWGIKATTFQIENSGIVSVFDAGEGANVPNGIVESILTMLSNESEYAFFTVAVSKVHESIDEIKKVYDMLIDISKFSKPISETQVLYEGEIKHGASKFYFSVEEMGKLSALLQNETQQDVVRRIDEIIDYNIKKDINSFELYLLCTEIINCAVKCVNRVLRALPQNINLSEVYRALGRAYTPNEYRDICVKFLCEVMEHISAGDKDDDYIISYILDYVDNHYSEDIYLNLFAEKLKLTGAYISSYFKEKMNVNLSDYINNYRIKKAVKLSENPQNKNKDIAVMVGLPNINTFIRLFKKYTGYTPGEYRKKHFGDEMKK